MESLSEQLENSNIEEKYYENKYKEYDEQMWKIINNEEI
jgi:hypothetical protein